MPRQSVKSILTVGLLAFACGGIFSLCPISNTLIVRPILANFDSRYTSGPVAPIPYERDRWLAGKAHHRVGMAQYLEANKILEGKTAAELVEMLGDPDINRPGNEGMRWLLGYIAKGLFDESIWLELTINEQGKATGGVIAVNWDDPRKK